MDAPRLTVAITVDHDAISDSVRRGDSPVKFSHAAGSLDGVAFERLDAVVSRWSTVHPGPSRTLDRLP